MRAVPLSRRAVLRVFLIASVVVVSLTLAASYYLREVYAATGINRTINFQGKLVGSTGLNVADGNYTVVFSIYDLSSGGTALWSETQTVTTTDGVFRVALGSVTAIPSNFNFNWSGLYLGMKVGADAEMTPRIRLTAVPYAFNAEKVSGLTVQDESGNASTSGTLRIPNGKTVSFGGAFTTSSANALTLTVSADTTATLPTGTVTLVGTDATQTLTNKSIGSTGLTFSGATTDITTGTNEDLTIVANGTGVIDLNDSVKLTTYAGNNAVLFAAVTSGLINTATTSTAGQCLLSGSGAGYTPSWGSCGTSSQWTTTGNDIYYQTGNVGIGLTAPGTWLHVSNSGKTANGKSLAIFDQYESQDILSASSSGVTRFVINNAGNVGIGTSLPSTRFDVTGLTISTDADATIGAANITHSLTKNDTNTRTFYGVNIKPTLNTGLTNLSTTYNVLNVETVNTATTGLTTNMIRAKYGASVVFNLDSTGTITGATWQGNTIGAGYGGTGHATITAGDLLVGASNSWSKLAIGTGSQCLVTNALGTAVQWGSCSSGSISGTGAAGQITFWNGTSSVTGDNAFWWDNTNKFFGIGTTAPEHKFQLAGTGNQKALMTINGDGSQELLTASVSGATKFLVDKSGNVGIGMTAPTAKLHVKEGGIIVDYSVSTSGPYINFQNSGTAVGSISVRNGSTGNTFMTNIPNTMVINTSQANGLIIGAGNSSGVIRLHTGSNSFDSERLRIDSVGNVGIGTTSPEHKFHLTGTGNQKSLMTINGDGSQDLFTASASGTTQFVIKNNGNVGIGMTAPAAKLDLKDSSSIAVIGSEMISNTADSDFSSSTGNWTGTNWSVSGGVLTHTAGANVVTLSNSALTSAPVAGNVYQITFTVNTTTAGTLTPAFGGTSGRAVGQSTGTLTSQTQIVTAADTSALTFTPDANWVGTIDNVSIKQVTRSSVAIRVEASNGSSNPLELRVGGDTLYSTFVGNLSGSSLTTGAYNAALGYGSLEKNTTGARNTAVGALALASNATGNFNTSVGNLSLQYNTSGSSNVAFGLQALQRNVSGSSNAAFGTYALSNNTTGVQNIAIGLQALVNNTTASYNTAVGTASLFDNTTGAYNTVLGYRASNNNTLGNYNISIGPDANYFNEEGSNNTIIGYHAGRGSALHNKSGNVFLGYQAGYNETGSNKLYIANSDTSNPLIYGDFAASSLGVNTSLVGDGALVVNQPKGTGDIFSASSSATTRFVINNAGNIGIGTTTPGTYLNVGNSGKAAIGKAIAMFDQYESQDIFTASSSGTPRFTITNAGGIKLGTSEGTSGNCLLSGGSGAAATWGSCGGGGGGTTNDTGLTYITDTTDDFVIGGNTTDPLASEFYFDLNNGSGLSVLHIGDDGVTNGGLTFHSSTTGKTATITTDASGNLTLSAASGANVVVGSGAGDVTISFTGVSDELIADKTLTLGANYAGIDYTFKRVITGGAFNQSGDVVYIADLSNGSGTNDGNVLRVNAALTSGGFTGHLLNVQQGGTTKFSVKGLGTTHVASIAATSTFAGLVVDNTVGDLMTASSSGMTRFTVKQNGNVVIGNDTDGLTFSGTSANSTVFKGAARPTKTITLNPEYPGSVITAFYGGGTDTNITGSLTSDTDTSGNLLRNYYQWSSSQAALHYYTVAVRVRLPKDFSSWATTNAIQVDYSTQSTVNTNNVVDVRIYNGDDTPGTAVVSKTGNVSGVASTWTTLAIDDSEIDEGVAPDWDAADETAVIYLRMGSLSSNVVKIGDIKLNYLAAF